MLKQGQGHGSFGIDAIRKQAQKSRNFVHKYNRSCEGWSPMERSVMEIRRYVPED
jgi:hypothetical protein